MSVTYFLVRVREPIEASGLTLPKLDERSTLPFGSAAEVKRRLLGSRDFEDRGDELILLGASGEHDLMLHDDPVRAISINRCAPTAFLAITDVLRDLGPFAIWSDSSDAVIDPESLRPREPGASRKVFDDPVTAKGVTDGLLEPRWQVEANLYLSDQPWVAGCGRVIVPTGGGVTVLDPGTGSTVWTRTVERRRMHATPAGEVVVLAGDHPEAFGLSVLDGSIAWRVPVNGVAHKPGARASSGAIGLATRIGQRGGELIVLDASTGAVLGRCHLERARTVNVAAAGRWLLVTADTLVSCFDPENGELLGSREIQPVVSRGVRFSPSLVHVCELSGRALVLQTYALESWALPELDDAETLMYFGDGCLCLCGDHVVAGGQLPDGGPVVLRVLAPPSFDVLHEIEIHGSPATPVDLSGGRCACLVRAPRPRPPRFEPEGEAHILVFETASGRILHEEPLGSRSWYPGHIAFGEGRLYVTYGAPGEPGRAFLRAHDVH